MNMNAENIEKWNINEWWKRIENIEDVIAEIAEQHQTSRDINELLLFNYGRVVLCLKEILTLLINGYPDGALAIARTVYEICTITKYIYKKYEEDNNTELIERYFDDGNIKAIKPLLKLNRGLSKIRPDLIRLKDRVKELKRELNNMKIKYGEIETQYWWARKEFKRPVTFKKIDESVDYDFFMRVLYERACIGIHASSIGSFALLGRENELGNIIYTTPTDDGFEIPLLLGMVCHDQIVHILCRYWSLNEEELLPDVSQIYDEYISKILS